MGLVPLKQLAGEDFADCNSPDVDVRFALECQDQEPSSKGCAVHLLTRQDHDKRALKQAAQRERRGLVQ